MKKTLSVLLAVILLVTPLLTLAENWICPVCGRENNGNFCPNDAQPKPETNTESAAEGPKFGDTVFFGHYAQGEDGSVLPIQWQVLEVDGDRVFLLSAYVLDSEWYNSKGQEVVRPWSESYLRKWMNEDFYTGAFTAEEQESILLTNVDNSAAQGNPKYNAKGEENTQDYIFALSYTEAMRYLPDSESRLGHASPNAMANVGVFTSNGTDHAYWWLRSPGESWDYHSNINSSGNPSQHSINNVSEGIRPAMWIRLSEGITWQSASSPTASGGSTPEPMKNSEEPATVPTEVPTEEPTHVPTEEPTPVLTEAPTEEPTPVPTEAPTEEPTPAPTEAPVEEQAEPRLTDYLPGYVDVYALIDAAEEALRAGMDPQAMGEELFALAEENGVADYLTNYVETITARGTEEYKRFYDYFQNRRQLNLNVWNEVTEGGVSVYPVDTDLSDGLKELLAVDDPQCCYEPVFWSESDFKAFYGVEFNKFKPSKARPGYVCIVVKDSTQSAPETSWRDDEDDNFFQCLRSTVSDILIEFDEREEDAPIITGNPQLASSFWVFDLQYPFYALYGREEPHVKGYNCSLTMTSMDAATHSVIATDTRTNKLANTIYEWHNWIAKADIPILAERQSFPGFINKIAAALTKERAKASASRKINRLNAGTVLNGKLAEMADSTADAWQKAVFNAGARDVSLENDTLSFTLRPYDPKLTEVGKYADAENKSEWLRTVLNNMAAYDLQISVKLQDGQIPQQGLTTIRQSVNKAATVARNAFNNKDLSTALTDFLLPVPVGGKVTEAAQLLEPSEAFIDRINEMTDSFNCVSVPVWQWASLFHARKNPVLNTKDGPGALTLTWIGADPASLLNAAGAAVLDRQAYLDKSERYDSGELITALDLSIAEKAMEAQLKGNTRQSVTFSLDDLLAGRIPDQLAELMNTFTYEDTVEYVKSIDEGLLDIAAIAEPKTGKLSGSAKGTAVNFIRTAGSSGAYIQMRDASTNELAVSCYVAGGKNTRVNVPAGEYIIVWATGPYWYGEEYLFGNLGSMSKSEPTEIQKGNVVHSFTLESTDDGTIGIHDADLSDFR